MIYLYDAVEQLLVDQKGGLKKGGLKIDDQKEQVCDKLQSTVHLNQSWVVEMMKHVQCGKKLMMVQLLEMHRNWVDDFVNDQYKVSENQLYQPMKTIMILTNNMSLWSKASKEVRK